MTPNLGQGACQALEDAATMTTWTSPPATAFRDTLTWLLGKLAPAAPLRSLARIYDWQPGGG
jgi:hypothetical protein